MSVEAGIIIALKYITSANEVADVLTKLLPIEPHEQHANMFLMEGHNSQKTTVEAPILPKENPNNKNMFKFDRTTGKWTFKH